MSRGPPRVSPAHPFCRYRHLSNDRQTHQPLAQDRHPATMAPTGDATLLLRCVCVCVCVCVTWVACVTPRACCVWRRYLSLQVMYCRVCLCVCMYVCVRLCDSAAAAHEFAPVKAAGMVPRLVRHTDRRTRTTIIVFARRYLLFI